MAGHDAATVLADRLDDRLGHVGRVGLEHLLRIGVVGDRGAGHDVRVDAARMEQMHLDVAVGQLGHERLGVAADGELGGAVVGIAGHSEQAEDARDVHEGRRVDGLELRHERQRAVDHAVEVDGEDVLERLDGGVDAPLERPGDAGVVDHDVGVAQRGPTLGGEVEHGRLVGHVDDLGEHRGIAERPHEVDGLGEPCFVHVAQDQAGHTLPGELGGVGPAHAGSGTRDDHALVVEAIHAMDARRLGLRSARRVHPVGCWRGRVRCGQTGHRGDRR